MVTNPIRQFHAARIRRWQTVEAEIDSCSWVDEQDNVGGSGGHYDVAFAYRMGNPEQVYHGHFCYPGSPKVAPYSRGEKLPIQCNSKKPASYTCSVADSGYEKIETIVVMILFALIASYVLYTF